jgi:hypothetical protein
MKVHYMNAKDYVPHHEMADRGNTRLQCEEYYHSWLHCVWRMILPTLLLFWV